MAIKFFHRHINILGTNLLKKLDLASLYSLKKSSILKEDGWFKSFNEESSIDSNGNPLPWFTYPAIEFIKKRIKKEMCVFEFGCGFSTIWWSYHVTEVISVEHDSSWYDKINKLIPENVSLFHINLEYGGDYSKKVNEFDNKFDIVVIDGRDRVNCAINSVNALKKDGIIIWDNSDRKDYENGFNFLYEHGFKKIEFIGLAPITTIKAETGIFYRNNNCLSI